MKFNFGFVDIDDMGVFELIVDVYDFFLKFWRMIYIVEDQSVFILFMIVDND